MMADGYYRSTADRPRSCWGRSRWDAAPSRLAVGRSRWAIGAMMVVAIVLKVAHAGYYVPEWDYRLSQGPWGRAIGQWAASAMADLHPARLAGRPRLRHRPPGPPFGGRAPARRPARPRPAIRPAPARGVRPLASPAPRGWSRPTPSSTSDGHDASSPAPRANSPGIASSGRRGIGSRAREGDGRQSSRIALVSFSTMPLMPKRRASSASISPQWTSLWPSMTRVWKTRSATSWTRWAWPLGPRLLGGLDDLGGLLHDLGPDLGHAALSGARRRTTAPPAGAPCRSAITPIRAGRIDFSDMAGRLRRVEVGLAPAGRRGAGQATPFAIYNASRRGTAYRPYRPPVARFPNPAAPGSDRGAVARARRHRERVRRPDPRPILPEAEWARTAIKRLPPPGPLDWPAIFGRAAPVVLELGCGNGRYTLLSALARPGLRSLLATDILPVVIRYATRRANQRGLHNVRFAVKDAQTFMRVLRRPRLSVAEIHLYHPQPYHDPRQAHLRLVTPRFLADVHRALAPGGLFAIQTDNPDYWAYIARVAPRLLRLPRAPRPLARRPRRPLAAARSSPAAGASKSSEASATRRDDLSPADALALAESLPPPTFRSRGPWCDLDAWEGRRRRPASPPSLSPHPPSRIPGDSRRKRRNSRARLRSIRGNPRSTRKAPRHAPRRLRLRRPNRGRTQRSA